MAKDKYDRRPSFRPLKDKILIMCGGETEEIYFNDFKHKHKKRLENVNVKVVTNKHSDPMSVVNSAIEIKNEYDEVWVVFDKDDFTNFDSAIIKGITNGINCAFSNEAIEYWFLLHYESRTGAISRSNLNIELAKKIGFDYDKGAETIKRLCVKLSNNMLIKAEENALIGHERHIVNSGEKPSNWCSCTTIYKLTKRLREWSKANKV